MLTRRLAALAAAFVVFTVPSAAVAAPPIGECPPGADSCHVIDEDPGNEGGGNNGGGNNGGGGDGGGGERTCTRGGKPIACFDPVFGWFNQSDECYYKLTEPQLPPRPGGGADGAWYTPTCLAGVQTPQWFDDAPAGVEPPPDPETLARSALAEITLGTPDLQIKPDPNGAGLVGLPVWLWVGKGSDTWGPISNDAEERGLRVEITASVTNLTFDLGDGGPPISCPGGGTPYPKGATGPSPDCGYVFTKSSKQQPGQKFTITATTSWTVEWTSSSGVTGTIGPETRQATVGIRINELQVVTE
ncbi:hypothetical protein GCM10022251_00700 [Phytohabitans flavus]|uniref:ATP/GTP-binding protein n=1 Tax=Phytohabitans flavus TaxID=1076124 RepID=A0A6F8Y438_9ACTN|nr:hypothetical protein [Phytohabitans flavus]BCB80793.1 hypothetical protein Pflav_072030 [Phytohabitans flavus]